MRPRLPCKSVLLFQIRSFLGVFPFCRADHLFPFTEFLPHGRVLFPLFPGPALRFAVSFRQSPHFQTVFRWSSWHAIFPFPYSPLSLSVCSVFRWIFILQHANNNGVAFRKNSVPLSEKYPRQSPKHRAERPQAKRFLPPPFFQGWIMPSWECKRTK